MDDLGKGYLYLIEEERLALGLHVFLRATRDRNGMIITRTPLEYHDLHDRLSTFPHFRFTAALDDLENLSPHNLPRIGHLVTEFLKKDSPGVLLLEGIEYLTTQNDFKIILRLIQYIYDKVSVSKSIVIMSVNALAFGVQEFHQLRSDTSSIPYSMGEEELPIDGLIVQKARP